MKRIFSKAFNLAVILRSSSFIAFIAFTASCGGGESTPKASVGPVAPATLELSSFTDVSYTEGTAGGSVTLNVELNRDVVAGENVTFDYATSDGNATASEDYTAKSATETILAGARTASITVSIINNNAVEGDETITVTLTPTGFTAGSTGSTDLTATITIVDDDTDPVVPAALELASFSDISYTEGTAIGSATLTVALNRAVVAGETVTFNYATSDGTATASDYTYTLGRKSIGEGAITASITVPITNDSVYEATDEYFTVTLTPTGFTAGSTGSTDLTATITIADDDTAPIPLELASFSDISYTEGTAIGSVTLTVELNRAVVAGETVTFDYATGGGTATEVDDYTAKSDTVTFVESAITASITVPITNDSVYEATDETIIVTLSDLNGFTAGSTDDTDLTATITIVDDDTAPIPLELASFADESYTEGTAIGSVTLTVELNRAVVAGETVTFDYATVDGTATAANNDYTAKSDTVTFVEGASTASIVVLITNDSVYEGDKEFTVTLSDLVGFTAGSTDDTDLTATITIVDDEVAPVDLELASFSDESYTEGTAIGSVTLTVELNRAVVAGETVTFDYATSDGTANKTDDYTDTSDTVTFVEGASTASITVPITNDSTEEVDKDFTVTLSDLVGFTAGSTDDTDLTATITIVDDDTAPVDLELASFADESYTEGTAIGSVTLTVELNRAVVAGETVTFDYATVDGTAIAGSDYTAKSATETILAGARTASITVLITNDFVYEGDKEFTVTLSDLNGFTAGSTDDTDLTAIITIVDDEVAPVDLELSSFSNVPYTEGTGGDAVTLTVVLNRDVLATDGTVTFDYATSDGTAKAGSDYNASSGTETIFEGARSASIVVATGNDDAYEIDEEFTVTLSNLNGFTAGSTDDTDLTATITIADNDSAPVLSSFADVFPAEGTGNATLTVELNRAVATGETVTFDYATSDGTAIAGSDYTDTSGKVTFAVNTSTASIVVPITDNITEESNKDFTVTLSNLVGFTADDTDLTATITIVDDDAFTIKLFADVEVYEVKAGTNVATLDVELSRAVATGETVSFTYSTSDGTATAGSDYTAVTSGSVSIAEGSDTATITIAINGDDDNSEGAETFDVTIVPTGFDATSDADSDATATVTINDYNVNFSDTDSDKVKDADDVDYDGDGLIEISSASQFDNIRYDLAGASYDDEEEDTAGNKGNKQGCGNGGTVPACIGYEMEEDIDLSTITDLAPIGSIGAYFSGIFEGNGNTLSGVSITNDTSRTGLFGVASGTIRNLVVTGEVIGQYDLSTASSPSYIGAVVGELAQGGVLDSVSADVSVSTTVGGYQWIGGLVGYNVSSIRESSATGDVTGGDGSNNVGGLVGSSGFSGIDSEIIDSYATGDVTSGSSVSKIGGLVGLVLSSKVISGYATGSVTSGSGGQYLGGLVGQVSGSDVINSYATGNVIGGSGVDEAGGLVGRVKGSSNILNSFAYSTSPSSKIDGGAGNDYVGGLVGGKDGNSKVENCYVISELIQGGTGIDYVGGLIGIDQSSIGSISYNYVAATVSGNEVSGTVDGSNDTVGRLWGVGTSYTNISNYYLDTTIYTWDRPSNIDFEGTLFATEFKKIDDETYFSAITALSSEEDDFGEDKGFTEINWDFTDTDLYPSLKSYKEEGGSQVEGDLICGQPDTNVQCTTQ